MLLVEDSKRKLIAGHDLNLESWSVENAGRLILEVLHISASSSEPNAFWNASTLFRDLVLRKPESSDIEVRFCESYVAGEQRAIVEQFECGLEHPHLQIRRHCIYTLGKICSVDSLGVMLRAFDHAFEKDPVILSRLVGEIRWIIGCAPEDDQFDDFYLGLLEKLVDSDSYLNRWAAVEVIQHSADEPSELLQKVKEDVHPLVRFQARSPAEAMEKRVSFGCVSDQFVSPSGYTTSEFDQFVRDWVTENAPGLI